MRSYVYATYVSLESVNLSRSRGKSRNNSVHRYVQSIFFFFFENTIVSIVDCVNIRENSFSKNSNVFSSKVRSN